jgi:hypothetical protein
MTAERAFNGATLFEAPVLQLELRWRIFPLVYIGRNSWHLRSLNQISERWTVVPFPAWPQEPP